MSDSLSSGRELWDRLHPKPGQSAVIDLAAVIDNPMLRGELIYRSQHGPRAARDAARDVLRQYDERYQHTPDGPDAA